MAVFEYMTVSVDEPLLCQRLAVYRVDRQAYRSESVTFGEEKDVQTALLPYVLG